jgi:hypothetical protein
MITYILKKVVDMNNIDSKLSVIFKTGLRAVTLFLVILLITPSAPAEDRGEGKELKPNNVYNIHGSEMGRVDEEGGIFNRYGRPLGSVDSDGKILNVSSLEIGKVKPDGSVVNQSGTRLGSVNKKGEIFNVSNRKVGEVKDISDIKLAGGAARLIFLK